MQFGNTQLPYNYEALNMAVYEMLKEDTWKHHLYTSLLPEIEYPVSDPGGEGGFGG